MPFKNIQMNFFQDIKKVKKKRDKFLLNNIEKNCKK